MKYQDVDVELTKEQEDALRRFLPISKEREFDYTPDAMMVLPVGKRPVFRLRELNSIEKIEAAEYARDAVSQTGESFVKTGYFRTVIRYGLVGWRGLCDQTTGEEVKFRESTKFDALDTPLLFDLVTKIQERQNLSAEERRGLR